MRTNVESELLVDVHVPWVDMSKVVVKSIPCALCDKREFGEVGYLKLNGKVFYVLRCEHDGLMWLDPQPGGLFYEMLYSKEYYGFGNTVSEQAGIKDDSPDEIVRRKTIAATQVAEWEKYGNIAPTTNRSRLVEIGGGRGYLSEAAHGCGWDVLNVEVSKYVAGESEASGVPTFNGTLMEAYRAGVVKTGTVDHFAGYDLIEHVPDPNEFLELVKILMRPSATIAFRAPNTDPAKGPRLHLIDHVYHYTLKTLTEMIAKHGMQVFHSHHSGTFRDAAGNVIENMTLFARNV